MDELQYLAHGFAAVTTWQNTGLMLTGILLGIVVGVLPGLGGPNGVAILLPLTFTMDPTSAIVMLSCIYWGALFGGAITSILFNIPGEAWSVATTFDGYPMAQQGKAAEALTAAFTSSFIGSLAAVLLITFLAPGIAAFALQFGPPEFFAVYLLTFCSFDPSARRLWCVCDRISDEANRRRGDRLYRRLLLTPHCYERLRHGYGAANFPDGSSSWLRDAWPACPRRTRSITRYPGTFGRR